MTLPVEEVLVSVLVLADEVVTAEELVSDEGGDAGCCLLKGPQWQLRLNKKPVGQSGLNHCRPVLFKPLKHVLRIHGAKMDKKYRVGISTVSGKDKCKR
jgi:hypothetical protein